MTALPGSIPCLAPRDLIVTPRVRELFVKLNSTKLERLLVSNGSVHALIYFITQTLIAVIRGQIPIRILISARELGIPTVAVYTSDDSNHATSSLEEASDFIQTTRFPLMIEAVIVGGGRGIRLIERVENLLDLF